MDVASRHAAEVALLWLRSCVFWKQWYWIERTKQVIVIVMDLTCLLLHLPWNCSGACAICSFAKYFAKIVERKLTLGGYPLQDSCKIDFRRISSPISCCSSFLQMHTHVCLTCDTHHWLDQVNGTLLMKAIKISSVVSWFQLGLDLFLLIFIRLPISWTYNSGRSLWVGEFMRGSSTVAALVVCIRWCDAFTHC